jgi:hypothetical protein
MNKTNGRHFFYKLAMILTRGYVVLALTFAVLIAIGIVIGLISIGGFLTAKALRLF